MRVLTIPSGLAGKAAVVHSAVAAVEWQSGESGVVDGGNGQKYQNVKMITGDLSILPQPEKSHHFGHTLQIPMLLRAPAPSFSGRITPDSVKDSLPIESPNPISQTTLETMQQRLGEYMQLREKMTDDSYEIIPHDYETWIALQDVLVRAAHLPEAEQAFGELKAQTGFDIKKEIQRLALIHGIKDLYANHQDLTVDDPRQDSLRQKIWERRAQLLLSFFEDHYRRDLARHNIVPSLTVDQEMMFYGLLLEFQKHPEQMDLFDEETKRELTRGRPPYGSLRAWSDALPRDLLALEDRVVVNFRSFQAKVKTGHNAAQLRAQRSLRSSIPAYLVWLDRGFSEVERVSSLMEQAGNEKSRLTSFIKNLRNPIDHAASAEQYFVNLETFTQGIDGLLTSSDFLKEFRDSLETQYLEQVGHKSYRDFPWHDEVHAYRDSKLSHTEDRRARSLKRLEEIQVKASEMKSVLQRMQDREQELFTEQGWTKNLERKKDDKWNEIKSEMRAIKLQMIDDLELALLLQVTEFLPAYTYARTHNYLPINKAEGEFIKQNLLSSRTDWVERAVEFDRRVSESETEFVPHPMLDIDFVTTWSAKQAARRDLEVATEIWTSLQERLEKEAVARHESGSGFTFKPGRKESWIFRLEPSIPEKAASETAEQARIRRSQDYDKYLKEGVKFTDPDTGVRFIGKLSTDMGTMVMFYHSGFKVRMAMPIRAFDENGYLKPEFAVVAPLACGGGTKHSNINAMMFTAENLMDEANILKDPKTGEPYFAENGEPMRVLPVIYEHPGASKKTIPAHVFPDLQDFTTWHRDVQTWMQEAFVGADGQPKPQLVFGRSYGANSAAEQLEYVRSEVDEQAHVASAVIVYGLYHYTWGPGAIRDLTGIGIQDNAEGLGLKPGEVEKLDCETNWSQLGLIALYDGSLRPGHPLYDKAMAGKRITEEDILTHVTPADIRAMEKADEMTPQWLAFRRVEESLEVMKEAERRHDLRLRRPDLFGKDELSLEDTFNLDWLAIEEEKNPIVREQRYAAIEEFWSQIRDAAGIKGYDVPTYNMYGWQDTQYPVVSVDGRPGARYLWPRFAAVRGMRFYAYREGGHDPMDPRRSSRLASQRATADAMRIASQVYVSHLG